MRVFAPATTHFFCRASLEHRRARWPLLSSRFFTLMDLFVDVTPIRFLPHLFHAWATLSLSASALDVRLF